MKSAWEMRKAALCLCSSSWIKTRASGSWPTEPPPRAELGRGVSNPLSSAVEWARGLKEEPLLVCPWHKMLQKLQQDLRLCLAITFSVPTGSASVSQSSVGCTSGSNVHNQPVFFSSTKPLQEEELLQPQELKATETHSHHKASRNREGGTERERRCQH